MGGGEWDSVPLVGQLREFVDLVRHRSLRSVDAPAPTEPCGSNVRRHRTLRHRPHWLGSPTGRCGGTAETTEVVRCAGASGPTLEA
jgi:hypothetical protein